MQCIVSIATANVLGMKAFCFVLFSLPNDGLVWSSIILSIILEQFIILLHACYSQNYAGIMYQGLQVGGGTLRARRKNTAGPRD